MAFFIIESTVSNFESISSDERDPVVISRSSMGGFSQEVLKNYFHMTGVTVLNSIWMDQMVICLYSQQQDGFTELTGCITRARDYLAEERGKK